MSDTTKKPSNAPQHPRTLEKQALERALQNAKPRTGYPYDWLDYEDYTQYSGLPKSDTHSHSSVSTDETSNEDPNKSSDKGE